MLEIAVENQLVDLVKELGGLALKWGFLGCPDRVVLLAGSIYLVELKKEKGRLTPAQKIMFPKITRTGIPIYVLWSKTQVAEFMRAIHTKQLHTIDHLVYTP